MLKKPIQYLHTEEDDLCTRSRNILKDIGGVDAMIAYFKLHGSFLAIRNSGSFTNKELTSFCSYLLSLESERTLDKIETVTEDLQSTDLDPQTISFLYSDQKKFLASRSQNALEEIELTYGFDNSLTSQNSLEYFQKCFVDEFDFKKLRNVGAKTVQELNQFRAFLRSSSSTNNTPEKQLLISQLVNLLNHKYSFRVIDTLVENERFRFLDSFCILLLNVHLTEKKRKALEWYFFKDEEQLSAKEIANRIQSSYELVRGHIRDFRDSLIPTQINSIKKIVKEFPTDLPFIEGKLFFEISDIGHFHFEGNDYTPNHKLSKLVYATIFNDRFVSIDSLIESFEDENRSFETYKQNLFVEKNFADKVKLNILLIFLNIEIDTFESIGFDYNLKVLINRFYNENSYEIDSYLIDVLVQIVGKIKRTNWEVNPIAIRRLEKREHYSRVVEIICGLLTSSNKPLRTKEILDELQKNEVEIEKVDLLYKLNKSQSTFVRLGNGFWGLKDWDEGDNMHGSLREITEDILKKRKTPVHLSELISIIEKKRKITTHSLLSNLRASESKMFHFFNCSYIGLYNKKYDSYWHNIPRFRANVLKLDLLKQGKRSSNADITTICNLYGYPKEHLKFILSGKASNKYKRK